MATTAPPPPLPPPPTEIAQQLVRIGVRKDWQADLYPTILKMSWRRFFVFVISTYLTANLVFALLYWWPPTPTLTNATGFLDCFFFSVQTWATIGYGGMTPTGVYANVIVTLESICGIIGVAITTGLVFAKFARPTARVTFASRAIVSTRHGKKTLVFRLVNERGNNIVEATIRVSVLRDEVTPEGERMRRIIDLPLVRANNPVFVLGWNVMHEIDEHSPLWGLDLESYRAQRIRLTMSLMGFDGTLSQTIHATNAYLADHVIWGARYVDSMYALPDGRFAMDFGRLHDIVDEQTHLPIPLA